MDMTEGPILKKIVLYTLPLIATGVLQLLFSAADLVVVGRFSEHQELSLAAVGTTSALTNLLVNLFIGLSVGAGVTVAQAVGARDDAATRRTVHTVMPLAIVSGLLLTAVGALFSGTFLEWMGTPKNTVLPLATLYMRIFFGGTVFNLVYNFGAAVLRAVGDTTRPLIYLVIAGVVNVVLNVIFVTALHMDVAGVALATIISQAISAVLVLRNLMTRTDSCRLVLKEMRFYKIPLLKTLRIGLPAGIQSSLFAISNVMIQSSVNALDSEAFAAGAIAKEGIVMSGNAASANIEGFVYMSMNGFYHSALNFTGQNVGAGRYDRVKRVMLVCLACCVAVGGVLGLSARIFGRQLLGVYIPGSEAAIAYGLIRLTYVVTIYFPCGMMDVMTGTIRGLGASLTPMLITIAGVCGTRIGFILTLFRMPQFHNLVSLYLFYPLSWVLTTVAQLIAFTVIYRKRTKKPRAPGPEPVVPAA